MGEIDDHLDIPPPPPTLEDNKNPIPPPIPKSDDNMPDLHPKLDTEIPPSPSQQKKKGFSLFGKKKEEKLDIPPIPKQEGAMPPPKSDFPPLSMDDDFDFHKEFEKELTIPKKGEIKPPQPPAPPKPTHHENLPKFPSFEKTDDFDLKTPMQEDIKFPQHREINVKRKEKPLISDEKRISDTKRINAYQEEKKELQTRHNITKPIFIRLDRFKGILGDLNDTRTGLRSSDDRLTTLSKSQEEKDKLFEKWNESLLDIQKKLIFIEKTIFEGD